jgi:hypothetical protein
MNTRMTLVGTLVLAAAIAIPVAQAGSPDDRTGPRGPGGISASQAGNATHPDNLTGLRGPGAMTPAEATQVSRPDDRAGARGPGATDASVPPLHPDDRVGTRGPGALATFATSAGSSGFDWNDALIGGLAGMGTTLLVTGCCFILVARRAPRSFA